MRRRSVAIAVCSVMLTAMAYASGFLIKCHSPECRYEASVNCNGFAFDALFGYCTTCRDMVVIAWKREGLSRDMENLLPKDMKLLRKPPKKVGTVWCWGARKVVALYKCPKCDNPFAEFDTEAPSQAAHDQMKQINTHLTNAIFLTSTTNEMLEKIYGTLEETLSGTVKLTYCPVCTNRTLEVTDGPLSD